MTLVINESEAEQIEVISKEELPNSPGESAVLRFLVGHLDLGSKLLIKLIEIVRFGSKI